MAEDARSLGSLREANLLLLSKLQVAQRAIWRDINVIKSSAESSDSAEGFRSVEFSGYGPNRTPVTLRRRAFSALSTRSPAISKEPVMAQMRVSTPRRHIDKENIHSHTERDHLNSILRTPSASQSRRKNKASEPCRHHVTFDPSTPTMNTTNRKDQSLLGYDWIAGMLDNSSYLSEKDEGFFEDLKEFRRVNRNECSGPSFLHHKQSSKSPVQNYVAPKKSEEKHHKCSDTYVVDDRLFAVPIHGSESYCTVCKTRKSLEYESEGSYVRISVPRSTLQSPHRVKPHRRKSFDPTDTVSLSKHCLLGWESSRPAVIPTQSSLDLRAHTGISKLNALNWSNTSLKGNTTEPILRSLQSDLRQIDNCKVHDNDSTCLQPLL